MNILVTGANGQLGSEIRELSPNSGNNYIFTDIAELDITNPQAIETLLYEEAINIVINCAAYTNVDKAEDDIQMANTINHKAVEYLSVGCRKYGATLIHISTDYVFSGNGNIPYNEEMETIPLGVYGETKLKGEEAVLASGCNYIIFRTSWLYSKYGNNFVKTMQRLTRERESLNVVFDQIGTPTHAADLAYVIYKVVEQNYLHKQGVYHFSNEGVCSWYDFAVEIAEICGNRCSINPCHSEDFPSRVKRPHYSVLDKTKVKRNFELTIPHWRESLKNLFQ